MQAAYYDAFQQPITLQTVPDPMPKAHGVVIEVRATGVCRSDWHGWMGHDPDITPPHVPGHELAGTVAALGGDVKNWRVGDRVTLPFVCGCGTCPQCQAGHQQVCDRQFQPGFTGWGSFAQYVAIDYADANLICLPDAMDFATAASLGCRFSTAFRAVVAQGKVTGGQWVAVHGCGGVGLSAVMIAHALGAQVIAIDINDAALQLAQSLGAAHTLNAKQVPDVVSAIQDISGGGAHVALDALGSAETCFNAVAGLRKRGKHIQVGLLHSAHNRPPLPMDKVIAHELEILGSHGMQAHAYPAMLAMIESGILQPQRLIGQRIGLAEAPPALMQMDQFAHAGVTIIDRF